MENKGSHRTMPVASHLHACVCGAIAKALRDKRSVISSILFPLRWVFNDGCCCPFIGRAAKGLYLPPAPPPPPPSPFGSYDYGFQTALCSLLADCRSLSPKHQLSVTASR